MLLAVARGVPMVNATSWIDACKAAKSFVPADGHILKDAGLMRGYPPGCSLARSYAAAAAVGGGLQGKHGLLTGEYRHCHNLSSICASYCGG